ncbi:MAG: thioredoxin-like domain-containing protein [Methanothrix sp.]|uniref:thioredoxin-like domain-containing protein n=1 Tax=Methanothrix sp. TaxID=90426 RepID=UPI0025E99171|nr:thioredoxin-like domain-containing protein [Methanothrix sp.]MCQ8903284.1 thioredoxin-like domain-containing protein [Methanothrix sp.]
MIAPEFPKDLIWLNTDRRYTLRELRGRFVLLDFWTYCCINCMHVIPELKMLEERYPELVVIGVHSAKFENEMRLENIERAIMRYGIEHPVVVDNDQILWRTYGIRAWPSFVLIAPDGEILGRTSGEGIFSILVPILDQLIPEYEKRGSLNRDVTVPRKAQKKVSGTLSFPGKVVSDGDNIFISDSNNNRILIVSPDGSYVDVIGSGEEGYRDGEFGVAQLFRPQGIAVVGDVAYIADTENHMIRAADLRRRTLVRVAGTGRSGYPSFGGRGDEASLSSPWDIVFSGEHLYIAMAGFHQIWRMDLDGMVEPFAGSGAEGIVDGPLEMARLAQPSGLTTDGKRIYFVDSESSSLRVIDGEVRTLIGRDLFYFGDIDGDFGRARLQHPMGLFYRNGSIYVADTYNHKIKKADLSSRTIHTLAGTGRPGFADGPGGLAAFYEPSGLTFLGDSIFIADTNNHAVRIYDSRSGEVSTMRIDVKK